MGFFTKVAFLIAVMTLSCTQQSLAACVNPPGAAGKQIYNTTNSLMQFCNGDDWIAMAPCPPLPECEEGEILMKGEEAWECSIVVEPDTTPDAFSFTDQTDVAVSTLTTSNSINIAGIDSATAVSVSGDGSPQIRINGGSWVTSGTITNGQSLEVRLTSSASNEVALSATVNVGGVTDNWSVTTEESADACSGSPSPGTVCADGSVYAGTSPDGSVAMYTTPADAPSMKSWNDGTTNWVDTAMVNCTSNSPGGQTSCQTGASNTALLAALSGSGTPAPYEAADYCDGLTAHGQSDWYLPSQDELNVLFTNRVAIGGFNVSGAFPDGWYWSSSENSASGPKTQRFIDGLQHIYSKSYDMPIRCVRK